AVPVVARIILVRSAFEVHRAQIDVGNPRRWITGLALSPALLAAGISPVLTAAYVNWHPSPGAAEVAVQAERSIQRCAQRFAADHGAQFPADLAALGPRGTNCLDASLAAGNLRGWSVHF